MKNEFEHWSGPDSVYLNVWLPTNLNTPVLDMGCGTGNFLYYLEKLGYRNLSGVDMDGGEIWEANKWLSWSTLIEGDAREVLRWHPQRFELITGFDVIEHFPKADLKKFFALVVQALTPGDRVIFQTPNAESLWLRTVAYGDLTHEWFFFDKPEQDAGPCRPFRL